MSLTYLLRQVLKSKKIYNKLRRTFFPQVQQQTKLSGLVYLKNHPLYNVKLRCAEVFQFYQETKTRIQHNSTAVM